MTSLPKLKNLVCWVFFSASTITYIYSDVLISDFSSTHPLAFSYPGTTWNTPVAQFESFTDGSVSGQQILPIGGGNPTVSGGAWRNGLSLDLSGMDELELSLRLLAGNEAGSIQVILLDADGTHKRYTFSTGAYNTTTFNAASKDFGSGVISASNPGSVAGLDLGAITAYMVQGNYYDPGGAANAKINVQLDHLAAVTIPEAASLFLFCLSSVAIFLGRKRK